MTRDELLTARIQWLTSAVRGLLKARFFDANPAGYASSAAGQRDAELRKEEDKVGANLDLASAAVRFVRLKAQQALEDFIKERL